MSSADILLAPTTKVSWADEEDQEFNYDHPQAFTDADGNKVVVEYKENEAGQRVKITRRIKTTLKREKVNKAVAEHKRWAKFGDERGHLPGPDVATTTVGEKVFLKLSLGGSVPSAVQQTEEDDSAKWKEQLKGKKILCRICKGDHFTTKCPYKGTLKPLDEIEASSSSAAGPGSSDKKDASAEPASGRYVAPALRAAAGGGERKGDSMRDRRDEHPTLRVTNLSEDTKEHDVHELFRPFGTIARVFLAKNQETGLCKGFAFVSFISKDDAAKAMKSVDGHGYDNLILRVEWAKSENK